MIPRLVLASSLSLLPLLVGCGVRELPPVAAPSKNAPPNVELPASTPAPGSSRVVLDANGQKAKVIEVTGVASAHAGSYTAVAVATRPVCTTPCVVDLPYGSHSLFLQSTSDETRRSELDLEVGDRPKIVRHELGEQKGPGAAGISGRILLVTGLVAAAVGGTLWLVGGATQSATGEKSGTADTGRLITGLGLGGVAVGIPLTIFDPPTRRPGATTEWSPEGSERRASPAAAGATRL